MSDNKNALPTCTLLDGRFRIAGLLGAGGFGMIYPGGACASGAGPRDQGIPLPQAVAMRDGVAVHSLSRDSRSDYEEDGRFPLA